MSSTWNGKKKHEDHQRIQDGTRSNCETTYLALSMCRGVSLFLQLWFGSQAGSLQNHRSIHLCHDLQKELTARKHADLPWLKGVSKWIVQNALRDLDQAYDNFFRRVREKKTGKKHKNLGFPKFKSKSQGRGSFRLDKPIRVFEDRIQLPKLGTIRLKEHSYIPTSGVKILSATVSERAGRWYVSVLVEESVPQVIPATGKPIGVDLGISCLAVCSDGRPPIKNAKALRANLKRLTRYQRHL